MVIRANSYVSTVFISQNWTITTCAISIVSNNDFVIRSSECGRTVSDSVRTCESIKQCVVLARSSQFVHGNDRDSEQFSSSSVVVDVFTYCIRKSNRACALVSCAVHWVINKSTDLTQEFRRNEDVSRSGRSICRSSRSKRIIYSLTQSDKRTQIIQGEYRFCSRGDNMIRSVCGSFCQGFQQNSPSVTLLFDQDFLSHTLNHLSNNHHSLQTTAQILFLSISSRTQVVGDNRNFFKSTNVAGRNSTSHCLRPNFDIIFSFRLPQIQWDRWVLFVRIRKIFVNQLGETSLPDIFFSNISDKSGNSARCARRYLFVAGAEIAEDLLLLFCSF